MSFILDALRKSDQQRQRGSAPTLATPQIVAVEARRPSYWVQGVVAAILVVAGVIIGWWRPWQPEAPGAVGQTAARATAAAKPPEPMPRQATPTPPAAGGMPPAEPPVRKPEAPPASAAVISAADRPAPSSASVSGAPEKPVTAVPQQPPAPEKAAGPADSAAVEKVMALSELPDSIRRELPAMQILLHQYSPRPRNRFVTINNQTLQEGEPVAPGLTLEQITPDGMILSYRGYRFRRGVP